MSIKNTKTSNKENKSLSVISEDIEVSEFIDNEIISKLDKLENNGNSYKKY